MYVLSRPRLAGLLLVLLTSGPALAGCGADKAHNPGLNCGEPGSDCYNIADIGGDYCDVRQVRRLVDNGKVAWKDLPNWVDRGRRNGLPIIVDFRHPRSESAKELVNSNGALVEAVAAQDQEISIHRWSRCRESLTEENVIESEGGPPVSNGDTSTESDSAEQ